MDPPAPVGVEGERRLDSWKEIAAFFRRDPRTVKRWEKERALPVHRFPGKGRSGVYAYAHELQRWLEHHGIEGDPPKTSAPAWRSGILLGLPILALVAAGVLWVGGATSRPKPVRPIPGADTETVQAYLECRYAWSKRSAGRLHEAVDCFTRLIERAPRFAPAYAGLLTRTACCASTP